MNTRLKALLQIASAWSILGGSVLGVGGLIYAGSVASDKPGPPGWKEIDACTPMQSYDDTLELDLYKNGTASLEKGELSKTGTWAYDADKRYKIVFNNSSRTFTFVPLKCILGRVDGF